jgi:argininosuccinate lyase
MTHLSRLGEEIVLWSSAEFGWVTPGDEVSTGSSALPHKRNPDIAELARGRAAAVVGDMTAILGLQKGLPLTYDRDLQEDKRIVFHADDTLAATLAGLGAMLNGLEFHAPRPAAVVASLELAEVLVTRGVAFREAHRLVGKLVRRLESEGRELDTLTHADLAATHPGFEAGDEAVVDLAAPARRSAGEVRTQIAALRVILGREADGGSSS